MQEGYSTAEIDGYSGFVFTNKNGYVHNPQTINRALERMRLACNQEEKERAEREHRNPVEVRHFSVHNLRHTFCTRFCENETNIKVIQEIMGHSDIGTTMNIYAEATESKKKERRALPMYVTYSDLIQIGIFICALVGLCYTIFKGKRK